ncbi:MAG TPA: hypothetical protein VEP50_08300 [bacterium]|nr:hypothetical protein [bacterium]
MLDGCGVDRADGAARRLCSIAPEAPRPPDLPDLAKRFLSKKGEDMGASNIFDHESGFRTPAGVTPAHRRARAVRTADLASRARALPVG